jgi:hypothetical protein
VRHRHRRLIQNQGQRLTRIESKSGAVLDAIHPIIFREHERHKMQNPSIAKTRAEPSEPRRHIFGSMCLLLVGFLQLGQDFSAGVLCVAEQHVGVLLVEDWIVDPRVSRCHRALHENDVAGFPYCERRKKG